MAGFRGAQDLTFTIDLQHIVNDQLTAIRKAVEAGCDQMLREAYEAGYEAGQDFESWCARGIGPYTDAPPSYEEWRDAYIKRHSGTPS